MRWVVFLALCAFGVFVPAVVLMLAVFLYVLRWGWWEILFAAFIVDILLATSTWPHYTFGALILSFSAELVRPRFSFYTR